MRIAIIDLGTNTFNLLIAELPEGQEYQILYKEELSVKLGEGSIGRKYISDAPFERGIAAIEKHLSTARRYKADFIEAYATSAIRSAENGKKFTDAVFTKFRLKINVIDGNREAELIYKGVKLALADKAQDNTLIMDIGGGSTEFILFNKEGIQWKRSFDLGVARLLSKIKPQDPLSIADVKNLENYIKDNLLPLLNANASFQVKTLIGCSGSFESFDAMISGDPIGIKLDFNEKLKEIDVKRFRNLQKKLIGSTELERIEIPGLIRMRADTIHLASIFVKFILSKLKIQKLTLSHFALKEGVLAEYISKFSQ